jgi:hypothetical protein
MRVAPEKVYKVVERFKLRASKQVLIDSKVIEPP